jgi:WXG100 family type VII secretion target
MTTGGGFGTELPTMQQASTHVYNVNDQIQRQLSDLLTRLEPLMGAWGGAAAASFQNVKQRWVDNAGTLNEALRTIGDGLGQAQQNYQAQEDTNTQDFTQIAVNLD